MNAFDPDLRVWDYVTGAGIASVQRSAGVDAVAQLPNCRGAGTNPILIIVTSVSSGTGAYTLKVEQPPALRASATTAPPDLGPPIPASALIDLPAGRR